MDFAMVGPALVLALGCMGSAIGCTIGGMAAQAVMSRVEENHGKFITMTLLTASQSLYGFVLMLLMQQSIKAGTLSPLSGLGIGFAVGTALLIAAIFQGKCTASGIQASAKQPSIVGKCFAMVGVIESFSIFAFVFALLLIR